MAQEDQVRTLRDKSTWGKGPWQDEPDHVAFEHEGLPCIVYRAGSSGSLCGYVAVPPGHPWHGKGYDDVPAEVHGGLTYASGCYDEVCHVPKPGESDDVWWLGFDTAHAGDYSPGFAEMGRLFCPNEFETYKTVAYVRRECELLAEQAAAARGDK